MSSDEPELVPIDSSVKRGDIVYKKANGKQIKHKVESVHQSPAGLLVVASPVDNSAAPILMAMVENGEVFKLPSDATTTTDGGRRRRKTKSRRTKSKRRTNGTRSSRK